MRLTFILLSLCLSLPALAEDAPKAAPEAAPQAPAVKENSVNLSPLGVAFGSYTLNYERLINGTHGLLVEGTYAKSSDGDTESSTAGGALGYRWHWSGKQNSGFLGVMAGGATGTGEATVNGESFSVDVQSVYIVPTIGRRWAWDSGFNITFRAGVGWANYSVSTDSNLADAKEAVDLVNDMLTLIPVAIDGELSLGWNF